MSQPNQASSSRSRAEKPLSPEFLLFSPVLRPTHKMPWKEREREREGTSAPVARCGEIFCPLFNAQREFSTVKFNYSPPPRSAAASSSSERDTDRRGEKWTTNHPSEDQLVNELLCYKWSGRPIPVSCFWGAAHRGFAAAADMVINSISSRFVTDGIKLT